ncbi:Rieske (2Fe-2S) protein [Saccharomonospora azurea]|uniref:Cytochrome bc1 complex Rieske iron-sulfur subunit n=1 Tax=Saccharomonospora azurea NA-128 TaxID=882081 RepID=H8G3D0_9PSEU|nr:Rieske (2Fe-2S) protein [Saccharomonospora azurea]EHK83195.1 ferredoxin subunit of nitrite reductase and ring-hydroxylating dioxygenase [Saccharomonospora azurea SZMC 14600]EHY87008.1 ferredoxin subunit of nitrite reductase and ring-hydroxylating dioxygenase [Saccharomonospora azurea NA-128]
MTGQAHSRRTVLTTGATVAGAALGTAALAACSGGPGGEKSPQTSVPKGTRIASLDDLGVGSSMSVTTPDGRKAIVTRTAKDEVTAFSAVCTHQGCTVVPEDSPVLRCPCHNSTFDPATGAVKGGPADAPLPEIGVAIKGNDIVTA